MKQTCYLLILVIFLISCGNRQTISSQNKLTGNLQADLKMLLPDGNVKADIMDGVLHNPRYVELLRKFQTAINENYGWYLEYIKTVQDGQAMPYNEKMGLTKEEYKELKSFVNNVEIVSTGKEDIDIEADDNFIRFKSRNKLADLDSVIIDLQNNIVTFGQYKMAFADTLNITDDKNGLKSKWAGYLWKFEEPEDFDIDALKDPGSINILQYTFTIGRLEKNGKTYMSLKGQEIERGIKTVNFELPVQF